MSKKESLQRSQKCPICSEIVGIKNKKSHMNMHFGTKDLQCQFCEKVFSNWGNLQAHQLVHFKKTHADESLDNRDVTVDSGSKKLPLKCKYCSKKFKSPSPMMNHMFKHSEKRHYTCHFCSKKFKDAYYIWEHLETVHPKSNNNTITVNEMNDLQNSLKKPSATPMKEEQIFQRKIRVGLPDSMINVNLLPRVVLSRSLTDAMSKCC